MSMIYDYPSPEEPIKQGDIFHPLPFLTFDLDTLPVINRSDNSAEPKKWEDIDGFPKSVITSIQQRWGIVASQDCDTSNSENISFFTIRPFSTLGGVQDFTEEKDAKWWMNKLLNKIRSEGIKWFYLPADERIGFSARQIVVFEEVFQVPRKSLESRKALRKGRLNSIADEHFRETLAQFFRRYPYNEWYPLSKPEFEEYKKKRKEGDGIDIKPYPWQE